MILRSSLLVINNKKLLQFEGFEYSHIQEGGASQERGASQELTNIICHFLIFGSSGSGKTSFFKALFNTGCEAAQIKFLSIRTRQ